MCKQTTRNCSFRPPCPHSSSSLSGSAGLLAHALWPCGILRVISCFSRESDMPYTDKSSCTLRLEDLPVILCTTRINIPKFFLMFTHCIYVFFFCVDLRAKTIDHELINFYNRDGVCLLHGTSWIFYILYIIQLKCRDSVIGITTCYRLDGPGIESRWRRDFPRLSRPALGYTLDIGSIPGVKLPGRGVDHPAPSSAEVKERVELYLYSSSGLSWPILGRTLPIYNSV